MDNRSAFTRVFRESTSTDAAADDGSSVIVGVTEDTDALRQEVEALRAAVQARDEFISMIVHEVRNPLTPLLMQTSSLLLLTEKDPVPVDRVARGVRSMNAIVEHLMRRTSVLLDISRMSAGIYRLEPSAADASAIVDNVMSRMSLEAGAAGSVLEAAIQADVRAYWDVLAFEQIADNLVSNAIKYGEGRPIRVTLSANAADACLTVSDHGSGIAPENLGRVFARFERAVQRGQASGFGIGLWLVGRLTHAMGGSIDIDSVVGEGTSIRVTLPRNDRPE